MTELLTIESDELRATINPNVGGTITAITHLGLGLSVLGKVPWDPVDEPIGRFGASDEAHWLSRYGGGWPLLFPNGGDACTVDGVFHGFHGEASISPWRATASDDRLELTRRFFTVPVEMRRELTVERDLLILREYLRMNGSRPLEVMWGHHPTFGSDLLAGDVEITSGAKRVTADDLYDPATNPLIAGRRWRLADASRKGSGLSISAGREDRSPRWPTCTISTSPGSPSGGSTIVSLPPSPGMPIAFPVHGCGTSSAATAEAPWHGRGQLIGVEPNTTHPANGLRDAQLRGSPLLQLQPGDELTSEMRLHVFKPSKRIMEVDGSGRAN